MAKATDLGKSITNDSPRTTTESLEPRMQQSNQKDTFNTGAQRDAQGAKSRPDLISPFALDRIGQINRMGAEHYGDRNWEKGMPFSRVMASAERHRVAFLAGQTDEDHLAQWGWNVLALLHFEAGIKHGFLPAELNDLPMYLAKDRSYADTSLTAGEAVKSAAKATVRAEALGWSKQDNAILHMDGGKPFEREGHFVSGTQFRKPTFYIAGPMRGYPSFNFPAFDEARDHGIRLRYNVISPADMDRDNGFHETNPPSAAEGAAMTRTFVERDTKALLSLRAENGDGIALLPGWEKSTGALAEFFIARWLGLKVVDARTFEPFKHNYEYEYEETKLRAGVREYLKMNSVGGSMAH